MALAEVGDGRRETLVGGAVWGFDGAVEEGEGIHC